ncbi:transporter substrate-binding domain-containing protein [Pseudomonas sp. NFXW11]|uniref:ATP-binding protein n=1 Tax=Pseudomonas sp. NFXW11 TaxID=2819531 RepID=UPI003CECCED2
MLARTYRRSRVWALLAAALLAWAALCGASLAGTAKNLPFKLVPAFVDLSPLNLAPADRQWLTAHPVLRVGIAIDDYQPIDITRDRNRYQGISADYLSLVGERLGVPMEVLGFSEREQAVEALRNGTIDILTSANGYERGLSGLRFTSDYMPDRAVLVLRRDEAETSGDLAGKKLVLLDGYANAEQVHKAYPNSQIMLSPNLYSGLEALNQGDADAFIGNEIIVRAYKALRPYLAVQIHEQSRLPPTGFAFATREDNVRLADLLEQALHSIDESLRREIQSRWTTGLGANISGEHIELSAEEQAWILQHPHVMVASQQYPPQIFKDKEGRWAGLNVDLLNRIARMTGLHFVHKESLSTAQTLELLESGQAQMNSTLTANEDRRLFLNFSHAFGGAAWVFVVRPEDRRLSSLEQMAGEVLALPARHTLESYIRRNYPDIRLRSVASYEEARALVSRGEAMATIQNEVQVQGLGPTDDGLRVGRSVEGTWSADEFSVRKDQPELLSILNKSLEALPVAELSAIRLKWLGATPVPMPAWQRVPTWVYWALCTALLFGLLSLAWSSRLKRQIQQRLQAEQQLNDQLVFKRALLDGIPNPIFVRDLEGRMLTCNKSYEQQLGTRLELIQGRSLPELDLLPPATARQLHGELMQLLATEESVFADRQLETRDGPIHAYQWTVPFYSAEGQLQGLLGGWIDITERKRLENQLLEARQAADSANAAKSAFLSAMSHEIRTPMTAIIGLLELEKEQARVRGVPFSEALRVAYQSAQELISLMGDSLDLAKIEAGHMQLAPQVVALKPFFESVRQLFEVTARNQDVALQLLFSDDARGRYLFDPLRLRQVLHNLLSNALKFTAQGEVRVTVERQPDAFGVPCVRISVADTGTGISAEQQAKLFTPFVQADALTASAYGGTGLGLSICRQLVELMGGRINLFSEPGVGTEVRIELYLERVGDDLDVQDAAPAERPPSRSIEVLVVDDLSANRMVLSQQLMFLGHRVVACGSAQEALQRWRSGRFDVVITDCRMPDMSGYGLTEALRQIEEQEARTRCAVIGCTANAFEDERERCAQAGMDQLLVKPVTLDQLAQALARFLPAPSFNIQTLQAMTQADEQVLQRMLQELSRNLLEERQALEQARAALDWARLGGTLHRLKGVCCLVDALPLAKACIELEGRVKGRQVEALEQQWPLLLEAIDSLCGDIQGALDD